MSQINEIITSKNSEIVLKHNLTGWIEGTVDQSMTLEVVYEQLWQKQHQEEEEDKIEEGNDVNCAENHAVVENDVNEKSEENLVLSNKVEYLNKISSDILNIITSEEEIKQSFPNQEYYHLFIQGLKHLQQFCSKKIHGQEENKNDYEKEH